MSNEESTVLNRMLYRRIKATFKHLRIANHGEKQIRKVTTDLVSGKKIAAISHAGEYYRVCCPCCSDTEFKCYINHMYGKDDEFGRPQHHLVHCFKAGCPLEAGDREAMEQVKEMLCGYKVVELQAATIRPGKEVDIDAIRATWPGEVIRIDKLPPTHEAVAYLEGRGYPVDRLGRFYNVHWVESSDRFFHEKKICIPIYHQKKMVGWQLRPPYDCDWKVSRVPKYYTAPGTPKSKIFYNLGNAEKYRVGVVMEGVTDVWSLGPQGVCTLGARMSPAQFKLFERKFRDHAGVLLVDSDYKQKEPEAYAKLITEATELHSKLKYGFCAVDLPHGDPGSLDRKFLRSLISEEAAKQGVTVSWKRR